MALKGSARIELTNEDGSTEIIEHGNMITNAVNDLLSTGRGEMSNIMRISNNNDSYVTQIFGGIMLFDEVLSDSTSDYYIPTTKVTGYASQEAYAGIDTARGSVNQTESGLQEDGSYKLVWDFATSQANGTIKSLGLCPNLMGQIGISPSIGVIEKKAFDIDKSSVEPFDPFQTLWIRNGSMEGYSINNYIIAAISGDILYCVNRQNINSGKNDSFAMLNSGILKLYRLKTGINKISLADRVGMATYIDCIDVQLPTAFISSLNNSYNTHSVSYSYDEVGKKLILYPCRLKATIGKNGTFNYVEIELENNMNVKMYTHTNNSGGSIVDSKSSSNPTNVAGAYEPIHITKDYVLTFADAATGFRTLYIAKRSDNTNIKTAKYEFGYDFSVIIDSYFLMQPIYTLNNIFVWGTHRPGSVAVSSEFETVYVLDMDTGLIKRTNAKAISCKYNLQLANKASFCTVDAGLKLKPVVNPFILTTKNNLDNPVTKTASQTMKIIYTLTESESA